MLLQAHKRNLLEPEPVNGWYGCGKKSSAVIKRGISKNDLQCPMERAEAFEPETYKSSLMKKVKDNR